MDEHQHHEELVKGIAEQMKPVLEKSEQANLPCITGQPQIEPSMVVDSLALSALDPPIVQFLSIVDALPTSPRSR